MLTKKQTKTKRTRKKWTPADVRTLMSLVTRCLNEHGRPDWVKIGGLLDRTQQACQVRYYQVKRAQQQQGAAGASSGGAPAAGGGNSSAAVGAATTTGVAATSAPTGAPTRVPTPPRPRPKKSATAQKKKKAAPQAAPTPQADKATSSSSPQKKAAPQADTAASPPGIVIDTAAFVSALARVLAVWDGMSEADRKRYGKIIIGGIAETFAR